MICRTAHNKNYTIVNNTICKDNRLSWKAKGIWLYAFSRPDDWTFNVEDLINQSTDGKDSLRSGLQELQKCGYLKRERIRNPDGTMSGSDWVFYEIPQPKSENPTLDNPTQEEPPLLSTEALANTEAASKQANTENASALLATLPFDEEERKSFYASFNADQCQQAVAFYKGKLSVVPDFIPDKGWLSFLAAAIHQNWPIPEKPIKTSKDPKPEADFEGNKIKAEETYEKHKSGLQDYEEISLFSDKIQYRNRRKDFILQAFYFSKNFDRELLEITRNITPKR